MPKVEEFCHFYNGITAEGAEFFNDKLSLCALCVCAVAWFSSDNGA